MPMLDAHIPAGALSPEAEERLMARLTDALILNEGADPANEQVRPQEWIDEREDRAVESLVGVLG